MVEQDLFQEDSPQKEKKKSPKQKQEDRRMVACLLLGLFVLLVIVWGLWQTIELIRTGEIIPANGYAAAEQQDEMKVEDNSANDGKKIDIDAMIKDLLSQVNFEGELSLLETSVAEGMVETTEGTDLKVYMGNGTYADELIVMTARSEKDAESNQENARAHLAEMKKQFDDYLPEQSKKIESAVQIRCGSYVVICVTSDVQNAEKIVDQYMKE